MSDVDARQAQRLAQSTVGQATNLASDAMAAVQNAARIFGSRQIGTFIVIALQFFGSLVARLLLRIPLIGAVGGAFVGFRKIVQPWMDNRVATAEWERQRAHEASVRGGMDHEDDFVDTGPAQRYFNANRARILNHLGGSSEHAAGAFDWYAEWEKWARQQWQQQQQQQQGSNANQRRDQQSGRPSQQGRSSAYKWDFDPNDPYVLLLLGQWNRWLSNSHHIGSATRF
jgi:hypothetical protein